MPSGAQSASSKSRAKNPRNSPSLPISCPRLIVARPLRCRMCRLCACALGELQETDHEINPVGPGIAHCSGN
jgi:hypothetical protein